MLLDLSPLRRHHDFRYLYAGQFVSAFGSFLTYVALPVQIYQMTKSSALVGLLGTIELVPLAATALWGGALADALDRRRLLLLCEAVLMAGSLALAGNALAPHPSALLVFVLAALMSAVNGIHTPSLTSLTPRLVASDELAAVAALSSLRSTTAAVAGPALAGVCIAALGIAATYAVDAATYAVSLLALASIRALPSAEQVAKAGLRSIAQGLAYAAGRRELIGTYLVDIVAMGCATPTAVFPELAQRWGGASALGYLYSAMSVGAFVVTVSSRWTRGVRRRGAAVVLAAAAWGAAIAALAYADTLWLAFAFLALAGGADAVSALFRNTIWNETIPPELRGRLAAIEQLSYMTGPLLGNSRAGYLAERFGLGRSIAWGGFACVAGVLATIPLLPSLWRYRAGRCQ